MSDRIEALLKEYPKMKMEHKCLELQIKNFKGLSESDMINSMYFQLPNGELVQTSGFSEKTANIAINYKNKLESTNRDWIKHLVIRYRILDDEIVFLEAALNSLTKELSELMNDLIIHSLTWDSISLKHFISRTMVAKRRKKAIKLLDELYEIRDHQLIKVLLE